MERRLVLRRLAASAGLVAAAGVVLPAREGRLDPELDAAARFLDENPPGTALFLAPHPDDEVLQQLVEIVRHVERGWRVIVVGGADGEESVALEFLNGDRVCGYHNYRHTPAQRMTAVQMGAARIIEQRTACEIVGVQEFIPGVVPESELTVDGWRKIILANIGRLGDGDMVFAPTPWETTSGLGNAQHGNGGIALQQLIAEGKTPKIHPRYTVFSRYWSEPGCPNGVTRGPENLEQTGRVLAAARVYNAFNPGAGSYGIGWCHSVSLDFEQSFEFTSHPRYLRQRFHL